MIDWDSLGSLSGIYKITLKTALDMDYKGNFQLNINTY